jgi:hypothetical protein
MESMYMNFEENRSFNPGLSFPNQFELEPKINKTLNDEHSKLSLMEFLNLFEE